MLNLEKAPLHIIDILDGESLSTLAWVEPLWCSTLTRSRFPSNDGSDSPSTVTLV